jgi:hypothetical protein
MKVAVAQMFVELPVGEGDPICNRCGHVVRRHGISARDKKEAMCFDCLGVGQEPCTSMMLINSHKKKRAKKS